MTINFHLEPPNLRRSFTDWHKQSLVWWLDEDFGQSSPIRDDVLIIGDSKHECEWPYRELIRLLGELGFSINWDKAVAPTQRLTFLGIGIDTVLRQLSLPESKLCELRALLGETLTKRSITKRDLQLLQSLVGKLNFAARVIFGWRTLMRRIIDVMNKLWHVATAPSHSTQLSANWLILVGGIP